MSALTSTRGFSHLWTSRGVVRETPVRRSPSIASGSPDHSRSYRLRTRVAIKAAMTPKPTVYYFDIRGRAEVVKLALSAAKADWDYVSIATSEDVQDMKANSAGYPFGQCPRYSDDVVDICQSNAIMQHLGRKYGMYGSTDAEAAVIDMVNNAIEDMRLKYVALIYASQLSDEEKEAYGKLHVAKEGMAEKNRGVHVGFLRDMLLRNNGGAGFVVGTKLSIADLQMWDVVDLHLRIFGDVIREQVAFRTSLQGRVQVAEHAFAGKYPELVAHHERIAKLPGITEYLGGPRRLAKVNNNGLG